jgi:hypothetical protein
MISSFAKDFAPSREEYIKSAPMFSFTSPNNYGSINLLLKNIPSESVDSLGGIALY